MMYDKSHMATGANSVGLVALLVYSLKEFKEINNNIDELRLEVTKLRANNTETTKRSNIVFNQLSQKLEENTQKVNKTTKLLNKELKTTVEETVLETNIEQDDIKEAIDTLMIN